ncbi:hypothetical protein ILUMI_25248 [Ignelater luminosus]|uniref:Glutathione S-transferase 1-1 n=1 Tax=Ignelater luminosus TaxID=2038154 RepID=A0A8K0G076_IGNLU|nr:hypothetical protein ILUMI_25248 [Ignelater luminosus]
MTIDLYYTAGSAPCRSVLLTAKLLGVNLNLKPLNLMNKEHLTPEFIKLNPQHTVPTLVDNGFSIWESYAIITYLVEKYGKDETLYPKDPKQRALINQKLYFDMGTLYHRFADYFYPIFMGNATPDPAKFEKVKEALQFLDTFLEGHEFIVGNNLTVADIPLVTSISTYDVAKIDFSSYKNVTRWYAKLKGVLPGFEEFNGKEMLTKMYEEYAKNRK